MEPRGADAAARDSSTAACKKDGEHSTSSDTPLCASPHLERSDALRGSLVEGCEAVDLVRVRPQVVLARCRCGLRRCELRFETCLFGAHPDDCGTQDFMLVRLARVRIDERAILVRGQDDRGGNCVAGVVGDIVRQPIEVCHTLDC